MGVRGARTGVLIALAGLLPFASWAWAQGHMGHGGQPQPTPVQIEDGKMEAQPPPIRTTMEELHKHGGVPPGWMFLVPPGDSAEGRKVFVAMQCFACHEIKGEHFPQAPEKPGDVGPELTGMGAHHPAEYFAEKLLNPNRVILEGPGYTGPDGLTKMPDYADSMTLRQLIDLVAYLKGLVAGSATKAYVVNEGSEEVWVSTPAAHRSRIDLLSARCLRVKDLRWIEWVREA